METAKKYDIATISSGEILLFKVPSSVGVEMVDLLNDHEAREILIKKLVELSSRNEDLAKYVPFR